MNPTVLTNLTLSERRLFFHPLASVPVEVFHNGDYAAATFVVLYGPNDAVVRLPDDVRVAPLADIRITHETLHTLERQARL